MSTLRVMPIPILIAEAAMLPEERAVTMPLKKRHPTQSRLPPLLLV
jgi:hypothetical protein